MSRWRIWLRAGLGDAPSEELVAASDELSAGAMRQAGRLVRCGRVAEDVPVARYAVALARERQRRYARHPSLRVAAAICAVLALALAGLAADAFARSAEVTGAAFGGFAVFILVYGGWRPWQERRHVATAEQVNRDYLRRTGSPYVPGGSPIPVHVSPLAVACSLTVHLAILIPCIGAVSLVLDEESLSPGKVLSAGATRWTDAAVAIFGVLFARSRNQQPDGRSIPEYQHLRDLD